MVLKFKIIHVIDSLGLGGAQRQLVSLSNGMDRARFDVQVVSLCSRLLQYRKDLEDAGVKVHVVPQQGKFSWSTLQGLKKIFQEERPDLVHCWLFTAGLYGRIAAWTAGVKRTVYGIRNTLYDMPPHYRIVDSLLARGTSRITVNAQAMQPELMQKEFIPAKKLRTIYNGIDFTGFAEGTGKFKAELGLSKDTILVGMVARMAEQKDHRTFLEAAAEVLAKCGAAVHFVLVGDGPLRPQYEAYAAEAGIAASVTFTGARRDVFDIIQDIDVCVLTTFSEGCSNVIMEAMAASKPVIASDTGGNAELIEHGVTGFIIKDRDRGALAGYLMTLIQDGDKRREAGRLGRARAEKMLSIEKMIRETETLYQELLAGKTEVHHV